MEEIILTRGRVAIVDDEDFEEISKYKWYCDATGYAVREQSLGNSKSKMVRMHRIVNKTPDGLETDHINGNKLDNRKENLRNCNHAENSRNTKKKNGSSVYKGVHLATRRSKKNGIIWHSWLAEIKKDKKYYFIGYFKIESDAAKAYDKKAIELHGEFVRLNFPV